MMAENNLTRVTVPAIALSGNRHEMYSVWRRVNADSPLSSRRRASKFCFYSLFTE